MNLANTLATKGSCLLGPIPKEKRQKIIDYCNSTVVAYADWNEIRNTILDGTTLRTLLQAVVALEPKAQRNTFVPSPFLVARAIRETLK